ncbi:xylosidase [Fulvivirga sp. M361]|uniref:glycoside hydrolase family 71/99-like protein n=1 Tax=Fulvivirga sp. M361 TaxID=2594266 RepID=UPI00117AAE9C|nr:glycoside hydrolase family 71/99-like protein [Fulvivirga sp. M361]TRX60170.1 xylosidase [Fulvivirga sp. M361]
MYKVNPYFLLSLPLLLLSCSAGEENSQGSTYDETGLLYTAYENLIMAGYQGWFAAEGDDSGRGWYHYGGACGFDSGCSTIDFWPDVSEYTKKYVTPFKHADGSNAYLYSPYDEESVDLHFKWMKTYGIDGVFMQRFVGEIKDPKGKRHFNKVLKNALKAAKKYERALCIMYDLSGTSGKDMVFLLQDWDELQKQFDLFNHQENPTYLRHNGRPLLAVWGAGFNDNRKYAIPDIQQLVSDLKGPENRVSVMLGVPYYWRTLDKDTRHDPSLHSLIKRCDIVMPWAVGRYNSESYNIAKEVLAGDIQWCKTNNVDYVPLVFPGFSWGNLKNDPGKYTIAPRNHGDFLWKQIAGAKLSGAKSLYVAMFDEVDEGTAIFKSVNQRDTPDHGNRKFIGIEDDLQTDYYLWLTGQGTRWFHGDDSFSTVKPKR